MSVGQLSVDVIGCATIGSAPSIICIGSAEFEISGNEYPTGGYDVDADDFGLTELHTITFDGPCGVHSYIPKFDSSTMKFQLYKPDRDGMVEITPNTITNNPGTTVPFTGMFVGE